MGMKKHLRTQQPGTPREESATVIVGRCTLAKGDYVQVAERSYIILGMD